MDAGSTVGALSNYVGIYMADGPCSVLENALKIYGGEISAAELYGIRGESVSGSAIFGLEVLAVPGCGVYLGDNPSGKNLQWFTWVGALIDTCGDLLRIHRGGATFAGQMHFPGLWMGYANQGSGQGIAIELQGIQDSTFRPDVIFNSHVAINMDSCSGVAFEAGVIQTYDRSLVGAVPIILNNSSVNTVRVGTMTNTSRH